MPDPTRRSPRCPSPPSGSPGGAGVFLLCRGLLAVSLGGMLATDYRGFAHWFEGNAAPGNALRKVPPWCWLPERKAGSMVPFMRVLGGVFAAFGLVALVLGMVFTAQGHGGLLVHTRPPGGPFALVYPALAVVSLFQLARPRGLLRQAWAHGGRPAAVGLAVAVVAFPAGADLGCPSLAVLGAALGGFCALSLFLVERRARRA